MTKIKRGDKVVLQKDEQGVPQGSKGQVMNIMGNEAFVAFNSIPALIVLQTNELQEYLKLQ